MLLFLLACFQVEEEKWTEWEETYSDPENTNTAPEISEAAITPETEVYNDSTLTCSATGTDAEDGELEVEYVWSINETQVTTGSTIDLGLYPTVMPNEELTCVATAVDGFGVEASSETSIIIENRNPIIDDIGLTDIEPFANATLSCSATATDEDEEADNLSISYVWDIDGGEVGTEDEIALTPQIAPVGATLTCTATVRDSHEGTSSEVTTGTIRNTPPEITEVNITPETGVDTLSTLTCSIVGSDLNDSDLVPSFVWTNGPTEIGQGETIELNSSLVMPEESVTCTATLEDNNGGLDEASEDVSIGNAPPVFATLAEITPNTGVFTGTQVQCSAVVTDSEDGSITPTYDWEVGGSHVFTGEFYTVLAEHIDVGQSLDCVASVEDSHGGAETSTASVLIENTAPVVNSVQIVPQQPEADDEVECTHDITDIDEETLNITYSWDLQGATVGSNATLDLSTLSPAVGESLTCTVSVSDGAGDSDSGSNQQLIENSAPEFVSTPAITPAVNVTVESLLTCSAVGTDVNDGSITPTYEWFNDGLSIGTGVSLQLDNSIVAPGESIDCIASLVDANGFITEGMSSVTVDNAPPVFDTPTAISSNTGIFTGAELTCSASVSDAEDGSLTPSYVWEVNGSQIGTGVSYVISAEDTNVGDDIFCVASVTDNHGVTETSADIVTIENTLPSISNIEISPAPVYNDSVINCSATFTDPDETLVGNFVWTATADGHEIAQGASLDLSLQTFFPGYSLSCEVDVEDSEGASAQESAQITIANRAPSAPTVSITWDPAGYSDNPGSHADLTCEATATDNDGDLLTYSYEWSDGVITVSNQVLSSIYTSDAETWTCTATADDGIDTSFDTASETISELSLSNCIGSSSYMYMSEGDFHFVGEDTDDEVGRIASLGDIDDDGLGDFIIATPNKHGGTSVGADAGKVYLFLGSSLANTSLINLSDADYTFASQSGGETAGTHIIGKDLDGDGKGEIIIAAPNYNGGNGRVYLFYAHMLESMATYHGTTSFSLDQANVIFSSGSSGYYGDSIDVVGWGGNALHALVIGSPTGNGRVDVFRNYTIPNNVMGPAFVYDSDADVSFVGGSSGDEAGKVASGDIDGDGIADIIIGSPGHANGAVYVVYGDYVLSSIGNSPITLTTSLNQMHYIYGREYGFATGLATGDFDGDGFDDLAIGLGTTASARINIVKGSRINASSSNDLRNNAADSIFAPATTDEELSFTSVGDINGDGYDDLLIGSPNNDDGATDAGRVYVKFGANSWPYLFDLSSSSATNFSFLGDTSGEQVGGFIGRAGDVNGDGLEDLLISAAGFDNGMSSSSNYGKVSLFLGCE